MDVRRHKLHYLLDAYLDAARSARPACWDNAERQRCADDMTLLLRAFPDDWDEQDSRRWLSYAACGLSKSQSAAFRNVRPHEVVEAVVRGLRAHNVPITEVEMT